MENTTPNTAAPAAETNATPNQATEAKASPTEGMTPAEIRKYKVKVMGEEREVDEKELIRGYSHQQAANKAMQEGLKSKKQAEEFISMLKDEGRLFEVLEKIGHNPRTLAEKYLAAQIEEELMDPKDRELKMTKAQIEAYKKKEQDEIERQEHAKMQEISSKYAKEYTEQFTKALEEEKLPAKKETIQDMARYIKRATEIGFKMTPQEAAKLVKEDNINKIRHLTQGLSGEQIVQLYGEDVANNLRKWDTSRVKTPEQNLKTPAQQADREYKPRQKPLKRMSAQEWREFNRKS